MAKLTDLPNIGKVAAEKLAEAGIDSPEALKKAGSREALLRVRMKSDPGACLSFLYGLEGAIQGMRSHDLPPQSKAELRAFFAELQ